LNTDNARVIADALTWSRIISVVPIIALAWYDLRMWVFAIYIAASLTDLFDGWFARRGAPPKSNVDLDGLADLLFQAMTLVLLWLMFPWFFPKYWGYFPILIALELVIIPVRIRRPELTVPHLQFGRYAMAQFLFLVPILILWGDVAWVVHLVLITGMASKLQLVLAIASRARAQKKSAAS